MRLELHPKQSEAFLSIATEILYGGAAGGGKSYLMRVAAIVWCMSIPGLQVYIFRRLSDDLKKNHMEGPKGFRALLADWVRRKFVKTRENPNEIEFWNGSKIYLCHCQHEKDVTKYQGAEIHVLIIDELTHFTEAIYKYLRGRCRVVGIEIPAKYAGQFPRILCGSNPGGVGHNWVKRTFVHRRKPMEIERMPSEQGGMLRQYIPARLDDNPALKRDDPHYEDRLSGLGSPALVKAMKTGNWDIVAGGALDDVWEDGSGIIVPRFKLPISWRIDRSFDWGSTHPFSTLWWGQADGTEAKLPDGSVFCPPKGSLVLAHEWYGAKQDKEGEYESNVGLKMPPKEIAKGIVEREKQLLESKWFHAKPSPGPADNEISVAKIPGTPTIAMEMQSLGITWTASDKSPGTRKNGLELMRARLLEARKQHPEDPAMYVMDHCRCVIDHWPVLPRDPDKPDDVDTNAEDHDYDAARYRVLATKPAATRIDIGIAH